MWYHVYLDHFKLLSRNKYDTKVVISILGWKKSLWDNKSPLHLCSKPDLWSFCPQSAKLPSLITYLVSFIHIYKILYVSVCGMCAHMCVCSQVCAGVCAHGQMEVACLAPSLLRQCVLLNLWLSVLTSLAVHLAWGNSFLCLPCAGIAGGLPSPPRFYVSSEVPNSGPHTWPANTLIAKLSLLDLENNVYLFRCPLEIYTVYMCGCACACVGVFSSCVCICMCFHSFPV